MISVQNKRVIRIFIAVLAGFATLMFTRWASVLCIEQKLGNGAYAVTVPLFSVLSLLAALAMVVLLFPKSAHSETSEDEDEVEELAEESLEEKPESPVIDESVYPELFTRSNEEKTEEGIAFPDIKKYINEQKSDAEIKQEISDTQSAWDEFVGRRENDAPLSDLYSDIPAELPEDYVPNYETEEEAEEEYEEEDTPQIGSRGVVVKATVAVVLSLLAVFLPANLMTVYTPEAVIKYNLFGKTEYKYHEADHYNVGVKLSGDISMQVSFEDKSFELVFGNAIKSNDFEKSFSSSHSYAAFCDRLMKKEGIDKHIGNLASLTRVPESEYAYANEMSEGYLERNN